MERQLRWNLRRLGFQQREIEEINQYTKGLKEAAKAAEAAREKKRTSALTLAQKRYQARQKAVRDGTPIPAWARKRLIRGTPSE